MMARSPKARETFGVYYSRMLPVCTVSWASYSNKHGLNFIWQENSYDPQADTCPLSHRPSVGPRHAQHRLPNVCQRKVIMYEPIVCGRVSLAGKSSTSSHVASASYGVWCTFGALAASLPYPPPMSPSPKGGHNTWLPSSNVQAGTASQFTEFRCDVRAHLPSQPPALLAECRDQLARDHKNSTANRYLGALSQCGQRFGSETDTCSQPWPSLARRCG